MTGHSCGPRSIRVAAHCADPWISAEGWIWASRRATCYIELTRCRRCKWPPEVEFMTAPGIPYTCGDTEV